MNKGAGGCYRIYHLPQFYWVFSNRVLCTRIHGSTVLLAPIKALPCLCIFPPMADDLRVVGDSGGLMWALLLLANSFSNPIIMNLFQYFKIFRP
jgi:hypothetical protein